MVDSRMLEALAERKGVQITKLQVLEDGDPKWEAHEFGCSPEYFETDAELSEWLVGLESLE